MAHDGMSGCTRGRGANKLRRLLVIGAAAVVVLVALNVIGVLRYPGGPLRDQSDAPLWLDIRLGESGSSRVDLGPTAGRDLLGTPVYYSVPVLTNSWPWPATVEAITPVDPTPGLVVDGVYVSRAGSNVSGVAGYDARLPAGQRFGDAFAGMPTVLDPSGPGPAGGARVELVAVEIREDGGIATIVAHTRPPVGQTGHFVEVSVADDAGTEYVAAGQGSGGGNLGTSRYDVRFAPAPPSDVHTLTIRIDSFVAPFPVPEERLDGPWEFRIEL